MLLLARVREATATLHRDLEAVLDISAQVQTRTQYEALLQRFHAFYAPWEAGLLKYGEWEELSLSLPKRMRVPRLEQDLAALEHQPFEKRAETHELPNLATFARALGSLYVLEGSTLGGQVLTRHFEAMGIPSEGLHFFRSHGQEVGRFWKEFCGALNRYGEQASEQEKTEVEQGACDSFAALQAWFRAHPVPSR